MPTTSSTSQRLLAFRPKTYWPNARRGASAEAEVVRITIASSSRDVVRLLARRSPDGRIHYRMVHEDANGPVRHRIRVRPASSSQCLTFEELVELLETACYAGPCPDEGDDERYGGVIWGTLRLNLEHGLDHADDYVFMLRIRSDFYPRLQRHYERRVGDWCLANCIEEEDCGRTVRLRTGSFPRKLVVS